MTQDPEPIVGQAVLGYVLPSPQSHQPLVTEVAMFTAGWGGAEVNEPGTVPGDWAVLHQGSWPEGLSS